MKKFNLKPLGAIISSVVLAAAAQSALAQEKDDAVVEEITVTGFAKSIVTAIEIKRNADTVVEAISAEDIGGLPDKSIADSLSRLPGITVTRKGGQAGTIQARGMGDGYVFSTLNGREQVSPSGARAMEFSQFPSELINSVEVYKSPKASLIEGGVAATVELKTVRPLDITDDHKFTVGLRGSYNDQAKDLYDTDPEGHRISFSYQQKLLDDTLGFSLGYAQLKEPKAALSFEQFQYDKTRDSYYSTNGMKILQEGGTSQRDGYMATVQFEPNENLSVEADAFYSKFDTNSNSRGLFFDNTPSADLYSPTYYGNFITGGNLVKKSTDAGGGMAVKVVNDNSSTNYDLFSSGINVQWKEDALTLSADISHSDASGYTANGNGISNLYIASAASPSGYIVDNDQQVTYQLDGINLPSVVTSRNYADTSTLRLTSESYYPYLNEDSINAVRFDTKYELDDTPIISSVEGGVRYSERNHKETRALFTYGTGSDGAIDTDYPLPINTDTSDIVHWKGIFSRFPAFLAVDGDRILQGASDLGLVLMSNAELDSYDAAGNVLPRSTVVAARWSAPWSFTQNSNIDENVTSLYVQGNIKTDVADKELTGNVGLRYVHTDQSNRSLADVGGDPALGAVNICDKTGVCNDTYAYRRIGTKYSNVLPSLNLNYHLTDSDQLRLALARVMSRAPISQLSSFDFGSVDKADSRGPTYNYGDNKSPLLKPFIADQLDLSYEHYMEETNGSFSVAAYYRNIKSFIQSVSIDDYDFAGNGFPIPATVIVNSSLTGFVPTELPVRNGTYKTALNNDKGGYIKGLEFAYTQTFDFLPSYWSGLGFSGSASFTDSQITIINTQAVAGVSNKLDFPGLVKRSANFTVFYSYESFQTRLSTTYQAAFVGESRTIGPTTVPVTYAPETVLDYQASYKFDSGIDLIFSVGNVTNEPNRSYMFNEQLPLKLNWFGRTYNLGANYTF